MNIIWLHLCCSYVFSTYCCSRLFSSKHHALHVYLLLQLLFSFVKASCRFLQSVWAFHSHNICKSLLIKIETYRACSCTVLALFVIAAHNASQNCIKIHRITSSESITSFSHLWCVVFCTLHSLFSLITVNVDEDIDYILKLFRSIHSDYYIFDSIVEFSLVLQY